MIKSQGKNGQRRETIVHFEEKDGEIKTKIQGEAEVKEVGEKFFEGGS